MPRLIPNWREVLRYAWSVKLLVLAALLSGAEAALPFFGGIFHLDPQAFALTTFAIVAAALVARVVAQKQFTEAE